MAVKFLLIDPSLYLPTGILESILRCQHSCHFLPFQLSSFLSLLLRERRILFFAFAQNHSPSIILRLPLTCRSVTHVLEKNVYIKLGPDNINNDVYYIIFSKKCQNMPPFSGFPPFINIPTRIIYSTFWRSS